MGAILKRLGEVIGLTRDTIKLIIYLVVVGAIYTAITMFSFADLDFKSSLKTDVSYYIQIVAVLGCSLALFFLAISIEKMKQSKDKLILDKEDRIRSFKAGIETQGYYLKFGEFLTQRNRERKLEQYRDYLLAKRDGTKNEKKRLKYDKLFRATLEKDFDIDNVKFEISKYTLSSIFNGYSTHKREDDSVDYSGREGIASILFPALVISIFVACFAFGFGINAKEVGLEQAKNFLAALMITFAYFARGLSYGEYSIKTVYFSKLDLRISVIKMFFQRQGMDISLIENEDYKYKVEIKEESVEEGTKEG